MSGEHWIWITIWLMCGFHIVMQYFFWWWLPLIIGIDILFVLWLWTLSCWYEEEYYETGT